LKKKKVINEYYLRNKKLTPNIKLKNIQLYPLVSLKIQFTYTISIIALGRKYGRCQGSLKVLGPIKYIL
jgi:hypothetical protein